MELQHPPYPEPLHSNRVSHVTGSGEAARGCTKVPKNQVMFVTGAAQPLGGLVSLFPSSL